MLAVIPVRDGVLPTGAVETLDECGGRGLLAGSGTDAADLEALGGELRLLELGAFAVGAWTAALAPVLADESVVVLPASPDGRDLAPRLAHALGRMLVAGAVRVTGDEAVVARAGGLELHTFAVSQPVVATLQPGVRGAEPHRAPPAITTLTAAATPTPGGTLDAEVVAVHPPDVTTMDLAEARRIAGGGAGLDGPERFERLIRVAAAIGGSMGATRVITDRGWVAHERQIGTTGVVVDPELYLALGISGAVQHTAGLGDPRHVISVNTDPHCPMMQMADLAVVADANAVLDELAGRLGVGNG